MSMASRAILSTFFEEQWTQNHPQYLSGLSRALFPTTLLKIAVYKSSTSEKDRDHYQQVAKGCYINLMNKNT